MLSIPCSKRSEIGVCYKILTCIHLSTGVFWVQGVQRTVQRHFFFRIRGSSCTCTRCYCSLWRCMHFFSSNWSVKGLLNQGGAVARSSAYANRWMCGQLLRGICCSLGILLYHGHDWEPPSDFCVPAAAVTAQVLLNLLRKTTQILHFPHRAL